MKTIVLLRHSKSSHHTGELADIQRPLNERGYKEAAMMSEILKKEKLVIDKIISSPAVRALSTALIFAQHLKVKHEKLFINELLYESGIEKIIAVIKSQDDKINQLMLVGHNPDFGELLNSFVKANTDNFPTTCIAIITFNIAKWNDINQKKSKLIKLLLPEQFRDEGMKDEKGNKQQATGKVQQTTNNKQVASNSRLRAKG